MRSIPEKLYNTLSADERVQLTIAALGREDEAEINLLKNTCQKFSYRMSDLRYTQRMEKIEHLTRCFLEMCKALCLTISIGDMAILGVHVAVASYGRGFREGLALGGNRQPTIDDLNIMLETAGEILKQEQEFKEFYQQNIDMLKARHQAFIDVCVDENLNVDDLLNWFPTDEYVPDLREFLALEGTIHEEGYKVFKEAFSNVFK